MPRMPTTVAGGGRKCYDFCGRWGFDQAQVEMARISQFWNRLFVALRYDSIPAIAWLISRKLLLSPFVEADLEIIYRKDLTKELVPYFARVPIEIYQASLSEAEEAENLRVLYPDMEEPFRQRLNSGHVCFVAKNEGKIVAYNWLCFRRIRDRLQLVELGNSDVYCTDAFTAEPWRGKAVHTELLYRMLLFAKEQGYEAAYTAASLANSRSRRTHNRLGWEISGLVLLLKWHRADKWRTWRIGGSVYPYVDESAGGLCKT